jgi:hypothetical protein
VASKYQEGALQKIIVLLAPTYKSGSSDWATGMWNYWVESLKVNYPIAADQDGTLAALQSSGKPAYLLVDLATMKIRHKQVGFHGDLPGLLGLQ